MANQLPSPKGAVTSYLFDVEAVKVPAGVSVRPKKLPRFDDPVIPRSYWYLTAGLAAAALALGLLLGRYCPANRYSWMPTPSSTISNLTWSSGRRARTCSNESSCKSSLATRPHMC